MRQASDAPEDLVSHHMIGWNSLHCHSISQVIWLMLPPAERPWSSSSSQQLECDLVQARRGEGGQQLIQQGLHRVQEREDRGAGWAALEVDVSLMLEHTWGTGLTCCGWREKPEFAQFFYIYKDHVQRWTRTFTGFLITKKFTLDIYVVVYLETLRTEVYARIHVTITSYYSTTINIISNCENTLHFCTNFW